MLSWPASDRQKSPLTLWSHVDEFSQLDRLDDGVVLVEDLEVDVYSIALVRHTRTRQTRCNGGKQTCLATC